MINFQVFPIIDQQTTAAINLFTLSARDAVESRGLFSVALSGGSTPEPLYAGLAEPGRQGGLPWGNIHFFFGDERNVPSDHPDSNFRMVHEVLFSKIAIPKDNIHRIKTEMDVRLAAFAYEDELRSFFKGLWPRFDMVLLGMGLDGHTASLFPNTVGLNEEYRWFIANHVRPLNAWRLTLTKNAINGARKILVLVNGQSKAGIVSEVLTSAYDPYKKPIQLITPTDGEMIWLLDREAASQLPQDMIG